MGLFEDQREPIAASTRALVESVLTECGHSPAALLVTVPGTLQAWSLPGAASTVQVSLVDHDSLITLRVVSPLLRIAPITEPRALFQRLLELNGRRLLGVAFALRGDEVWLVSERSTIDLDRSEIHDAIARVQRYAETFTAALLEEFGGTSPR